MTMNPEEYTIAGFCNSEIYVLADMLAYAKDWPNEIEFDGHVYQFQTNEIMPDYYCGSYSGYASYRKV